MFFTSEEIKITIKPTLFHAQLNSSKLHYDDNYALFNPISNVKNVMALYSFMNTVLDVLHPDAYIS